MMRFSVIFGVLVLAACSGGADTGNDLSTGPDEFGVMTNRALQQPDSFVTLPTPTPGGANRADLNPQADAIAALGGRSPADIIPTADAALLAQAQRFGVDADIRTILGVTPVRSLFSRGTTLDAYAELDRFRALGVMVPTAPPRP